MLIYTKINQKHWFFKALYNYGFKFKFSKHFWKQGKTNHNSGDVTLIKGTVKIFK